MHHQNLPTSQDLAVSRSAVGPKGGEPCAQAATTFCRWRFQRSDAADQCGRHRDLGLWSPERTRLKLALGGKPRKQVRTMALTK